MHVPEDACARARKWAQALSEEEAWAQCDRADWMLWWLGWNGGNTGSVQRRTHVGRLLEIFIIDARQLLEYSTGSGDLAEVQELRDASYNVHPVVATICEAATARTRLACAMHSQRIALEAIRYLWRTVPFAKRLEMRKMWRLNMSDRIREVVPCA